MRVVLWLKEFLTQVARFRTDRTGFWASLFACIAGISVLLRWCAGIALHLYTVIVVFQVQGTVASFVTFIFPGIAQIYWIYTIWDRYGDFWSVITIVTAAYILIWLALFSVLWTSITLSNKFNRTANYYRYD